MALTASGTKAAGRLHHRRHSPSTGLLCPCLAGMEGKRGNPAQAGNFGKGRTKYHSCRKLAATVTGLAPERSPEAAVPERDAERKSWGDASLLGFAAPVWHRAHKICIANEWRLVLAQQKMENAAPSKNALDRDGFLCVTQCAKQGLSRL